MELQGFRNFAALELDLQPGLVLLVGGNGQGKTSLLEALYLLSSSRSFRTHREGEWVGWGRPAASVMGLFERGSGVGRPRRLEMAWEVGLGGRPSRRVWRNRLPLTRMADFLGEVPLSLFVPGDLALVQGAPQDRRRYLDRLLCKLSPLYLGALGQYQQALRQRNELLRRRPGPTTQELGVWEVQLARLGSVLTERRREAVARLHHEAAALYRHLAQGKGALGVRYQPGGPEEAEALLEELARRRSDDLRRRSTSVGPHRDDLELSLDGRSLRQVGSQGQQRSAALGLRLAEARLLGEGEAGGAMVLLDDCFSELDPGRRARLLELLEGWPQVFVTTTDLAPGLPPGAAVLRVVEGQVVTEGGGA